MLSFSIVSADVDKWYLGLFPWGRCSHLDIGVTLAFMKVRMCTALNADRGIKWARKKDVPLDYGLAPACTQLVPWSAPAGRTIIMSIFMGFATGFIGSAMVRRTTKST